MGRGKGHAITSGYQGHPLTISTGAMPVRDGQLCCMDPKPTIPSEKVPQSLYIAELTQPDPHT